MEMLEETAAANSKGLPFLPVVWWEISEAEAVVFIPPVLAAKFI